MCIRGGKKAKKEGWDSTLMEFYEVKTNHGSKHNRVFNVNLIQTFTSIYVPITKWLLNFASKPFVYKK